MGASKLKGRAKLRVKIFEYSTSREYSIQPDVVEYKDPMDKPGFDLILPSNTMKTGLEISKWVLRNTYK